VPGLLLS